MGLFYGCILLLSAILASIVTAYIILWHETKWYIYHVWEFLIGLTDSLVRRLLKL